MSLKIQFLEYNCNRYFVTVMLEEKMERLDYLYNMLEKEEPSLLGFEQIYMINLERRPDRRFKMRGCFEELGIKYKYVPAVDGK